MLDFNSGLDTWIDGTVYLHRHRDTVMKFLKTNYKVAKKENTFEKNFELLPPDPREPERILVNVLAEWIEGKPSIRAIANKRFRFNKVNDMFFTKCPHLVKCVGIPKEANSISFTCNDSIVVMPEAPDIIHYEYRILYNKNLKFCKLPKIAGKLSYVGNKNYLTSEELSHCQYQNYDLPF